MIRNKQNTTLTNTVPPNMFEKCTLRIKKASAKPSKAGNMMVVWDLEIVHPTELDLDGTKYNLDSLQFTTYIVLKSEKMDNCGILINQVHPKLGLPEEIDDENPNTEIYEGVIFDAMVSSEERLVRNRRGNEWEEVKDADGKPQSLGWQLKLDLRNIIGLSTVELNRAF